MRRVGKKRTVARQRLRLHARATVSEVAAAAIAESLSQLSAHLPLALRRQHAESLHQARVSLRKLRVYVQLFRSRIGRTQAEELVEELRWTFRLLGKLRDIQVFTRDVVAHVASSKQQSAAFHARLARLSQTAAQALEAPATQQRFDDLCAALEAVVGSLAERRDERRARPWLAKRLDRQGKRLRVNGLDLSAAKTELHDLRKRAKKHRYTTDLVRALGKPHPKRERRFRAALTALQDNLGALNDAEVARGLVAAARAPAVMRTHLLEILESSTRAHRAELPNVYACFVAAQPFWQ